MPTIILRLSEEAVAALRARAGEHSPGRAGGVSEVVRRLLHEATGVPLPPDPHEEQSRARRGQPNPNHPRRKPTPPR